MNEIETIIAAVSERTEIPKSDIISGGGHAYARARQMVCHILKSGFPYLIKAFADKTDNTVTNVYKSARIMDVLLESCADTLDTMNEIRVKLALPKLKGTKREQSVISPTKRMFGFDYTEAERTEMRMQMLDAKAFMHNLSSYGEQPREPGFFERRVRPQRTYESWYKRSN